MERYTVLMDWTTQYLWYQLSPNLFIELMLSIKKKIFNKLFRGK